MIRPLLSFVYLAGVVGMFFIGCDNGTDPANVPDPSNGNAPSDIKLSSTSIDEMKNAGAVVGTLSATYDGSATPITYSIVNDNSSFSISDDELVTKTKFAYSTTKSIDVTIKATDTDGLSFQKTFTINIKEVSKDDPKVDAFGFFGDEVFSTGPQTTTNWWIWEKTCVMNPNSTPGANGTAKCLEVAIGDVGWTGWGIHIATGSDDLSAYANGKLHIWAKSAVVGIGVMITSADGGQVEINLTDHGFKIDNQWHHLVIPCSAFAGIDWSQINMYLGFTSNANTGGMYTNGEKYYLDEFYFTKS